MDKSLFAFSGIILIAVLALIWKLAPNKRIMHVVPGARTVIL